MYIDFPKTFVVLVIQYKCSRIVESYIQKLHVEGNVNTGILFMYFSVLISGNNNLYLLQLENDLCFIWFLLMLMKSIYMCSSRHLLCFVSWYGHVVMSVGSEWFASFDGEANYIRIVHSEDVCVFVFV